MSSGPLFGDHLMAAVLAGHNIPAHDETFDLAREIGDLLGEFRAYVVGARDREQADAAVKELITAALAVCL